MTFVSSFLWWFCKLAIDFCSWIVFNHFIGAILCFNLLIRWKINRVFFIYSTLKVFNKSVLGHIFKYMGTCMSIAKETFLKILHMIFTRSNPVRFNVVLISSHYQKVCHFKCYSICQDSVNLKVIVLFNGFFFFICHY